MRSIAVVALLCSFAAAEPARTAVDKLVRTSVATVDASLLADGAVIDVYGIDESADLVAVGALRSHGAGGNITRKIEPRGVTVIADDAAGTAWFVAPYALDIVDTPMGVLEVHTGSGWPAWRCASGAPGGSPGCSTRARCRTRS